MRRYKVNLHPNHKLEKITSQLHQIVDGDLTVNLTQNNQSAFGEIKTCNLTPVVQEMFSYNINPRIFNTEITNSGTVTQANSMAVVSSGTTTDSQAIVQSRKHIRYRPGMGLLARFTGLFTTGVADTMQYLGIGDEHDGFFMGYNGVDFGILHRNSSSGAIVDSWIPQTTWNKDKADGTGNLSLIDWTQGNVFEIQLQYLGFGTINFYVENSRSGKFVLVHSIDYANNNTQPSLGNPSLPYYMFVNNDTTTTDVILKSASCGLFVEGESGVRGIMNSVVNSKSGIGSTETNVITLKSVEIYAGEHNHSLIYPVLLNIASISGTKPTIIKLTLNTTLGGTPSYTNVDVNNSIASYDVAGTTLSDGYVIATYLVGKEDNLSVNLTELDSFLEHEDSLTVSAYTSSGSVEIFASISFKEDI